MSMHSRYNWDSQMARRLLYLMYTYHPTTPYDADILRWMLQKDKWKKYLVQHLLQILYLPVETSMLEQVPRHPG